MLFKKVLILLVIFNLNLFGNSDLSKFLNNLNIDGVDLNPQTISKMMNILNDSNVVPMMCNNLSLDKITLNQRVKLISSVEKMKSRSNKQKMAQRACVEEYDSIKNIKKCIIIVNSIF
jgi:hypothetical protein